MLAKLFGLLPLFRKKYQPPFDIVCNSTITDGPQYSLSFFTENHFNFSWLNMSNMYKDSLIITTVEPLSTILDSGDIYIEPLFDPRDINNNGVITLNDIFLKTEFNYV